MKYKRRDYSEEDGTYTIVENFSSYNTDVNTAYSIELADEVAIPKSYTCGYYYVYTILGY